MDEEYKPVLEHVLAPENQHESVMLARALCPFAERVTDAVILICVAMVEAKSDIDLVVRELGYSRARVRAYLQSHQANRIMRELSRHKLTGEGYLVAITNLIDVAACTRETGTARNSASKTLIELNVIEEEKHSGSTDEGKDLNEMTLAELQDYTDKIKADLMIADV